MSAALAVNMIRMAHYHLEHLTPMHLHLNHHLQLVLRRATKPQPAAARLEPFLAIHSCLSTPPTP